MKKIIITLLHCLLFYQSFSQKHMISLYFQGEYNGTLQDVTKGNNPWSMGVGVQSFLNVSKIFKPTLELTADAYLEDDKVLRLNSTGEAIADVRGMFNLFAGASIHPVKYVYVSFTGGPSRITSSNMIRWGVKPSFGLLSKNKRWTARVSYINIFKREETAKEDFTSISFSIGKRL